jgi:hypoxanthine phosphoribosyltransferase
MANIIPLISAEQINFRLHEIGQDISAIYSGKSLILVCILKGSFIFTADLARHINIPISIDFLGTKSYEGSESSGIVQITILKAESPRL